jgi:REP element-mobilizing transposase RayT
MHYFDGNQYELGCYVVMPNHVHAIIRPMRPVEVPLEKILQGRKLRSSREINASVGCSGALWQEESFDRIIRDEEHLWKCIQYIARNPHNAALSSENFSLWLRPSWETCGWRFE